MTVIDVFNSSRSLEIARIWGALQKISPFTLHKFSTNSLYLRLECRTCNISINYTKWSQELDSIISNKYIWFYPVLFLLCQINLPLSLPPSRTLSDISGACKQHHHCPGSSGHPSLQSGRKSTTKCQVAEEWCASGAGTQENHHKKNRLWFTAKDTGPWHHRHRLLSMCRHQRDKDY